jgi:hypothetical protein
MFAVWTTGIVLAIRMRRRQPGAALAAAIAFATFMLLAVINLAFIAWGSSREGSEDEYYHSVFVAKNILIPIATAGAWIVFLCALFGWRDSAPTPVQATRVSREVVFGTFAGACVGGVLAAIFGHDAPFLSLFGSDTSLVMLAAGWGAVAGGAIAATTGLARGAIAGGVGGFTVVFIWASRQDYHGADTVLRNFPLWFVAIGIVLGMTLARGWQALRKK